MTYQCSRNAALLFINCIRQLVAQELDNNRIHISNTGKFLSTSEVSVLESIVGTELWLNMCWCISGLCKYKNAIVMSPRWRLAQQHQLWLQKAYCRWWTYYIKTFTSIFVGKFYEQMVALIQSRSLELHQTKNKLLELVNWIKVGFLFVGLNLNCVVKKKKKRQTNASLQGH